MLSVDLATTLHQQRRRELEGRAAVSRLGREAQPARRSSRAVRVHVGWWLVATGLRLAVWDRRATSTVNLGHLPSARSPSC
jgi:hypothetical protein